MKGPSLRLKFDIRRRWECPACHARVRSAGAVTSVICASCQKGGSFTFMQLITDGEPLLRWRDQIPVATAAAPAAESMAPEEKEISVEQSAVNANEAESPVTPATTTAESTEEVEDSPEGN